MHPRPVRLVCFDLGGVIVKTRRTWEEACAAAGFQMPAGGARDRWQEAHDLHDRHQLGHIPDARYLESLCGLAGNGWTERDVQRIHAGWLNGEYRGMKRIVELLHGAGLATACLSNTNSLHWAILEAGGTAIVEAGGTPASPGTHGPPMHASRAPMYAAFRRLQHRHASHLLGMAKPSLEIYREFERRTGHAAREILFFDDLELNVASARDAGWRAEEIDPSADPAAQVGRYLATHEVPGVT